MRFVRFMIALAALVLFASAVKAQTRITGVTPDTAKAGDEVSASGEDIDGAKVDKLYLTNGKDDFEVQMSEQTEKTIKFKIPADMKPGRWALMVRTKGADPKLMEQPIKVTVE
jgi:hypothetical protein